MKSRDELDGILNSASDAIRAEQLDQQKVDKAAARVWTRLNLSEASFAHNMTADVDKTGEKVDSISGCEDFQRLIPAYLRRELVPARALLLQDHTHECVPCRRALKNAREGKIATVPARRAARVGAVTAVLPRFTQRPMWRLAIAASIVAAFALALWQILPLGSTGATVYAADGPIYAVSDTAIRPMHVGDALARNEILRTGKDANAVMRLDGEVFVELKDRSEVSVSKGLWRSTNINLERGNVIVRATGQSNHRLYVLTDDSSSSVNGTISSINHGTKGTRVSVIDGHADVTLGATAHTLNAGQQAASQSSLVATPIQEEVAWSRDAKKYAEILDQLAQLRSDLNKVPMPAVRYSSTLLDNAPDGTVFYAALPNLTDMLVESQRIMQERINQNPALKEWWEKEQSRGGNPPADVVLSFLRGFGERLGDEIVLTAEMDKNGSPTGLLGMANVKNSSEFHAFLEEQIRTLRVTQKLGAPALNLIADPLKTKEPVVQEGKPEPVYVWLNGDLLAVATHLDQLKRLQAKLNAPGPGSFANSPFHERIAQVYKQGAGVLVAADLQKIIAPTLTTDAASETGKKKAAAYKQLGLLDFKYLIAEQKQVGQKTQSRALVTFTQTDHGITSWLAAPGPMGALDFVSPDANVVAAFVIKQPTALVDDMLKFMETGNTGLRKQIDDIEQSHGISIRNDLAAPLGGEVAFALDGPILPTPSWKMVVEVYDTDKLQQAFEKMVKQVNEWSQKQGKKGLSWNNSNAGGRRFYILKSEDYGVEYHYTYANGYMVAAASRPLLERTLQQHDAGQTIVRSERFKAALPADGNANFSALVYQNLAALTDSLPAALKDRAEKAGGGAGPFSALANSVPTLAYIYAENGQITFATNTDGGPFGIGPATLLGMPTSFELSNIVHDAMREKHRP